MVRSQVGLALLLCLLVLVAGCRDGVPAPPIVTPPAATIPTAAPPTAVPTTPATAQPIATLAVSPKSAVTAVESPASTPTTLAVAAATGVPATATRGPFRVTLPIISEGGEPTPTPVPAPVVVAAPLGTPRPSATATPTPAPVTKVTKWGVGLYRNGGAYIPTLLEAKPTTILLVDPDVSFAREVRRWFPKAFIVGRIYLHETKQPLDNPSGRAIEFADRVAAIAVPLKGVVDAWMSYNEVVGHNDYEQYRAYNAFQVAFAQRLQDHHGIAAVAGNDGSGTVEPQDYPKYFAEAIRTSKYFGLHSYSPLGSRSMRDAAEWNTLRHRKIHEALEASGVRDVQMVITESGLGDGWNGYVSEDEMTEDFIWFTDELYRDPYVIGHAAYGIFGDGTWKTFDMNHTSILRRLGDYTPPDERR